MNNSNVIVLDSEATQTSSRLPLFTWPRIAAISTALIGAATVVLHLMGVVIHQTYLNAWGIDSNQFPKSVDWLLTRGYYGVWNGAGMLLLALLKNFYWVVLAAAALVVYARLLTGSWNPFLSAEKKLAWIKKLPQWTQKILAVTAIGVWLATLLVSVTVVLFFLLGLPATAGRILGIEFAESNIRDFSKGCQKSRSICVELMRKGESFGTGYVLESSSTHLAYFDIHIQRARVIPRDDVETVAARSPERTSDSVK